MRFQMGDIPRPFPVCLVFHPVLHHETSRTVPDVSDETLRTVPDVSRAVSAFQRPLVSLLGTDSFLVARHEWL